MQFTIQGLDCAAEVAILKREVGPVVGGEDRLSFDLTHGQMTVAPGAVEISPDAVLQAVARAGMRAEVCDKVALPAARAGQVRLALRLEVITLAWMVVEAVVSIGAGLAAGSVLLLAFGADSIVELLSASVLYWRLRREACARPGDEAVTERVVRRTAQFAGYLLYALAFYVLVQSCYGLLRQQAAETSWWGMAVAAVAALGMPLLARAKLRVADAIGSRALRADAVESLTCAYMSWVLLAGLAANALLHWWWLDSAAALVLVPFLVKEGREAISGECCGDSGHEVPG